MAKSKKYVEDIINEEKVSETPTVLVSKSPDNSYPGELSPNPAKSGFTKQSIVDSLPLSGEPNVIYLVPRKVNGGIVGYNKYQWNIETSKYERVYGSNPNLKLENGGHGTLAHENNQPRPNPEKIFNGLVIHNGDSTFNKEPVIEGKPLHEWVDAQGGVTEEELRIAIQDAKIKILTLENLSGTLTDAQYTLALRDDVIIKLGTQYYYKDIDSAVYLVYKAAIRAGSNSAIYETIQITKSNKAWEYSSDQIVSLPTLPTDDPSPKTVIAKQGAPLSWENVVPTNAIYNLISSTELDYKVINYAKLTSDTTFTLATAPNTTFPEYQAIIINDSLNAITITLPIGTVIKTNDSNITVSTNTFTLPANTSVELNIQKGIKANDDHFYHAIVFNWDAQ